jgi:hypothetical protein
LFRELPDILIITDGGKVLASKISNHNIDETLFGMLISALTSYASQICKHNLKSIEFNKIRFDFLIKDKFIFMASSSIEMKHKKALKILNIVSEVFFKRYPKNKLQEWDGNLNIFQELAKDIKKSIDDLFVEHLFKEKKSNIKT